MNKINLDYGIHEAKDRCTAIQELLDSDNCETESYWFKVFEDGEERVDNSVKVNINSGDKLISETYPAKRLDSLASYILNAPSEKKIHAKENIKIYNSHELFKKALLDRQQIEKLNQNNHCKDDKGILILKNLRNYKKEKTIKTVKQQDLKLPFVADYDKFYWFCNRNYKNIKSQPNKRSEKCLLTRVLAELKKDELKLIKDMRKPIVFKNPLPDKGEIDYGLIDFGNKEHLKILLTMHNGNISTDLGCSIVYLNEILSSLTMTQRELTVLTQYRRGKLPSEISTSIGITTKMVTYALDKVLNKIIEKDKINYWKTFQNKFDTMFKN